MARIDYENRFRPEFLLINDPKKPPFTMSGSNRSGGRDRVGVKTTDLNGNIMKFGSLTEAGEHFGIAMNTISSNMTRNENKNVGYVFGIKFERL